jgi:hypothetical protein
MGPCHTSYIAWPRIHLPPTLKMEAVTLETLVYTYQITRCQTKNTDFERLGMFTHQVFMFSYTKFGFFALLPFSNSGQMQNGENCKSTAARTQTQVLAPAVVFSLLFVRWTPVVINTAHYSQSVSQSSSLPVEHRASIFFLHLICFGLRVWLLSMFCCCAVGLSV